MSQFVIKLDDGYYKARRQMNNSPPFIYAVKLPGNAHRFTSQERANEMVRWIRRWRIGVSGVVALEEQKETAS